MSDDADEIAIWRTQAKEWQQRASAFAEAVVVANNAADAAAEAVGSMAEKLTATLAESVRLRAVVRKIVSATGAALEGENDECLSYASDGEYASAHEFTPDEMAAYRAVVDATLVWLRQMTDLACAIDVVHVADLYRTVTDQLDGDRTVTPEELGNPDWYAENTVEIGGEVMTQAQYDAARFPLTEELGRLRAVVDAVREWREAANGRLVGNTVAVVDESRDRAEAARQETWLALARLDASPTGEDT